MLSSAQMGAIITSTTPAFMVLFARMILKEKITARKGISIVLATIGVCVIVGTSQIDPSNQLGGLSLIIAALTWSLMSVLVKRVPGQYSLDGVQFTQIAAAVLRSTTMCGKINRTFLNKIDKYILCLEIVIV
ncbi:UNVERIFIED_CONTAM: drug/metabolite transporter (DMT)-like permease [Brevibacillus sp. OAP136]